MVERSLAPRPGQRRWPRVGIVQSIRPPSLPEIYGPPFMSHPADSNVQYRLTEENA
jgi:hypothetical protein